MRENMELGNNGERIASGHTFTFGSWHNMQRGFIAIVSKIVEMNLYNPSNG